MLCTARTKDTALHRGTLVDVTQSTFAPSTTLRRALASGSVNDEAFAERYALELRQRWSLNPLPFREVIAQATSGDVTLVDTWGDVRHAPRRVLARVLAQIARSAATGVKHVQQQR